MVEMTSPGVYVTEVDASEIVPSVSSSTTVFGGDFTKGIVDKYTEITSVDDLIEYYGLPTNDNYNDWYQCYNFLQYGNRLLISRACNLNGYPIFTNGKFRGLSSQEGYGTIQYGSDEYGGGVDDEKIIVNKELGLKQGDIICFTKASPPNPAIALDKAKTVRYYVVSTGTGVNPQTGEEVQYIKLDRDLELPPESELDPTPENIIQHYLDNPDICVINEHHNGSCEALEQGHHKTVGSQGIPGECDVPEMTWKTASIKYTGYNETTSEMEVSSDVVNYTIPVAIPNFLDGSDYFQAYDETGTGYPLIRNKTKSDTKPDGAILFDKNIIIKNEDDFDFKYNAGSIAFASNNSKLKFISKTPGVADSLYSISIALPTDFASNDKAHVGNHCTKYVAEGISVDSLFEYAPAMGDAANDIQSSQIAVVIYDIVNKEVKESYICSLDPEEKDSYNNSMFIEKVINRSSRCVYVVCNTATPSSVKVPVYKSGSDAGDWEFDRMEYVPNIESYTLVCDYKGNYSGHLLRFSCASDSVIQTDDLLNAYEVFENKDLIDVDIVIANELDNGLSAKNLAESRLDCISFMGIPYKYDGKVLVVSKRSAEATSNIVNYRNILKNYNTMWVSLSANYKYQYDRYNDTYRWVNVAGDVAGLRAKTNQDNAPWWASAGLNRGQIKNVIKLAYNPNQTQRGTLYTNGINAIVDFPGQGIVLWGQKTMLDKASSFDRVNVRGLFLKNSNDDVFSLVA